ncbi:MAG: sugar phosphate isomerase/epimerase [bacterium]|nr:sugar phosphate isomerase/epimerase [bacterium]MCM1375365.1 sugar phosphate isomerase/epimerase [Muribaculum sp.]
MIEIIPEIDRIEEYVKLAEQYSLGFEYNDFFAPELLDDREAIRERISRYRRLGRPEKTDTMHGAFFDIVPFSWDSGISRHSLYRMQQSAEIAAELGCRAVIFHAGLRPQFAGNERYYRNWLETMSRAAEELTAQWEVEIYYENVEEHSPAELRELADRLCEESRFGICLDVAHMLLTGGEPEEWFRVLAPYIRHFHLNDHHLKEDEHLALGCGSIDWKDILGRISRHELQDRSILLEVNGLEKITLSLEYLHKICTFA